MHSTLGDFSTHTKNRKMERLTSNSSNNSSRSSSPTPPLSTTFSLLNTPLSNAIGSQYKLTMRTRLMLLASFLFSLVIIVSMVDSFLHYQYDGKGCQVPYMRPRFVRQTGFDSEMTRFAGKYGLYLYRELGVDLSDEVTGTPVLFIPGHAGSYKQVRTIAAEAAYQYYQQHLEPSQPWLTGATNLDVFTVDFHEEFSALHGQSLLEQAEYINDAIDYILKLYPQSRRYSNDYSLNKLPDPTSIIVIGHSMGGIVARTAFTLHNYQPGSIHNVITLSTPHLLPPAPFDWQLSAIYDTIDAYWRQGYSTQDYRSSLQDVMLISIAGGTLDSTICSDSTNVGDLIPAGNGFTVFTTAIPHVWSAADHNEILACHQLERILAKSLLDIIDVRRGSQTKSLVDRMDIMQKSFLSGLEGRQGDGSDLKLGNWTFLPLDTCTILNIDQPLNIAAMPPSRMTLLALQNHADNDALTLLTDQPISDRYGLFLCRNPGNEQNMVGCRSVNSVTVPVPSSNDQDTDPFSGSEFAFTSIVMKEMKKYDYIGVMDYQQQRGYGNTQQDNSFFLVDSYSEEKHAQIINKSILGIAWSGIQVTVPPSLFSTILIPAIENPMLAYHLKITSSRCSLSNGKYQRRHFSPFLRQSIDTMYESKFYVNLAPEHVNRGDDDSDMTTHISVHGRTAFSSVPINSPHDNSGHEGLLMQFWMDPLCDEPLRFELTVDWYATIGRIGFRNGMVLLTFSFIVVLLVFVCQLHSYNRTGNFPSFNEGLASCYRHSFPWTLLLISLASAYQCHYSNQRLRVSTNQHSVIPGLSWIFWPDILTGNSDSFFWWTPALGLIVSIGMISGISVVTDAFLRWCASATLFFPWATWTTDESQQHKIRRRIIATLVLFLLVATAIPYQFVFVVAFLVHLVTCIRALKKSRTKSPHRRLDRKRTNRYHYMQTLLLLLLTLLPFNLPILVVWIRNMSVYWLTPFSSDHNIFSIAPFLIYIEMLTTNMKMIPRQYDDAHHHRVLQQQQPQQPQQRQHCQQSRSNGKWWAWITYALMYGIITYSFLYGVKYAHSIYFLSNYLILWLLFLHYRESRYSHLTFTALIHFFTLPNKRRRSS